MRRTKSFFLQAEDGIRDYKVTGVQTCALPIWSGSRPDGFDEAKAGRALRRPRDRPRGDQGPDGRQRRGRDRRRGPRSEERRVGKERRCGGEADDGKKEAKTKDTRGTEAGEEGE